MRDGRHTPPRPDPLVSIVINNYNYARYLRQAIDSALAQTYPSIEVVVVDDGSTDASPEIVRSYGTRIKAVLKENAGQGSAFNAGVTAARGELIALLDSDDLFLPDKIERCVRAASEYPSAQLIYHRMRTVDAAGALTGGPFPRRLQRGGIQERVVRGGGTWLYAPTSGQVYRRSFLSRILPVPEQTYRISADAYVACLAGMLAEVAGIEDVLAHYRVHGLNAYTYSGRGGEPEKLEVHNRRYVAEAEGLNAALERLGSPRRITLADNFIYQLNLVKCGQRGWSRVCWLTLRDRSERWVRVKTVISNVPSLLRTARGAGSPRWGAAR
jgi:glycosyltransferase involved in cell wall biosynthesis